MLLSVAAQIREETVTQRLTRTNVCAEPVQDGFLGACNILSDNVAARDLDRTLATIGLVTAGVSAVATATAYLLTSGKSTSRRSGTQITPVAGPHQTGLAVVGTF